MVYYNRTSQRCVAFYESLVVGWIHKGFLLLCDAEPLGGEFVGSHRILLCDYKIQGCVE